MKEILNKLIMYHQILKMSREGWSVSRISSFLGTNWRTTKKYLKMSEEEFLAYQQEQSSRHKLLSRFEGFVKIKLERFQDTKAAQMHDWLKEHYIDFPEVSPKTVYNFVMWVRQQHNIPVTGSQREFGIIEELPYGQQAQVDFGEYNMRDGSGKRVKVYFFCMVLSRSRYKFVYYSLKPFTSVLAIYAHMKAFEYFGGIPKLIVYDQDKVFLHDENLGDLILSQEFQAFVTAMPFDVHFCRKSDPQSKGKVENVVKYVKQNFLYNRPFVDIDTLILENLGWLDRTANGMTHAVTKQKPKDLWVIEREHLLEIPPYVFNEPDPVYPVRLDNSVLYKSNLYTVPVGTYKGRGTKVTIKLQEGELIITDLLGELIASHKVCLDKGRVISNTNHKRDKTKKLDALMLDVAILFPDNDMALSYLERIRKVKPRYARDQFIYIRKCVSRADVNSVTQTLQYCVDNGIYNARDFEAVMDKYLRENKAKGIKKPNIKQVRLSINKKVAEIIPNTSNILDYEKIMKN
jgi:hypothetical protein